MTSASHRFPPLALAGLPSNEIEDNRRLWPLRTQIAIPPYTATYRAETLVLERIV
jgi:hypothetical protein